MSIDFDSKKWKRKPENFSPFRERLHEIIFEAETPAGKLFDVILLIMILLSILVLMLETIPGQSIETQMNYYMIEWVVTIFFTLEYIFRLYAVYSPRKYALSFFGIIDVLSIIPTYISLFIPGAQSLMIIRSLRLLRVFRIFKLDHFMEQGAVISHAIKISRPKITIFLFFISIVVVIFGSIMYTIEHAHNPSYDSIPRSIYWAIITLTTVGYGDISPTTPLGQGLASIIMILGYAVIAVPTGIVTSALMDAKKIKNNTICCKNCGEEGHDQDAIFCRLCGEEL